MSVTHPIWFCQKLLTFQQQLVLDIREEWMGMTHGWSFSWKRIDNTYFDMSSGEFSPQTCVLKEEGKTIFSNMEKVEGEFVLIISLLTFSEHLLQYMQLAAIHEFYITLEQLNMFQRTSTVQMNRYLILFT